jgi:hypothetical protein
MSEDEDKLKAAIELVRRTGANQIQVRYSDDEKPVIWLVVAIYKKLDLWEVAAAHTPTRAALRLCEKLLDGGMCTHCKRPVGLEPESLDRMPMDDVFCWYQYDPELKTFRRGCE